MAFAVSLACSAFPAWAQQPRFETPEAAVEAMNQAMLAGDWDAVAATSDPEALRDFRAILMPVVDSLPAEQPDVMVKTIFAATSAASLREEATRSSSPVSWAA